MPTTGTPVRPDAVTALLGQIWDDALDPGYAQAAAARRSTRAPAARAWVTALALSLVGVVLAVGAASTSAGRPVVAERRASLVQRIQDQTAKYDRSTNDLTALQVEVERLKDAQLGATSSGEVLKAQIAQLAAGAAQTAVTGPGLVVTVDDAATSGGTSTSDPELGRVLDADLQLVVNGLWAAGATAVAVNGVRLTGLSSIRSAGDAILVDYRPLVRPYVVTGLGDPASIEARFASGPGGRGLRTLSEAYGVRFSVSPDPALTLSAATTVTLRYARAR